MKTQKTLRPVGGIYRESPNDPTKPGKPWILEWPSMLGWTLGCTHHETLAAANAAARKHKLAPKRWAGCDRE